MSFSQLPTEVLFLIISYLNAAYFREDAGRLTLFKRWYDIAIISLYRDLQFSNAGLKRFVQAAKSSLQLSSLLSNCVHSIQLDIKGFTPQDGSYYPLQRNWDDLIGGYEGDGTDESNYGGGLPLNGISGSNDVPLWSKTLQKRLSKFSKALPEFKNVSSLEIHLRPYIPADCRPIPTFDISPLFRLLSLRSLTKLVLDLAGSEFQFKNNFQDPTKHLCVSINNLIPTLETLRCRMPFVRRRLLKLSQNTSIKLKEVILNFAIENPNDELYYSYSGRPCGHSGPFGGRVDKFYFESQLNRRVMNLSLKMDQPRMVRIIYSTGEFGSWYYFNALTNTHGLLATNGPWDSEPLEVWSFETFLASDADVSD